uniref:Olfactomedin-like domain-containing protein n=1 Tax=Romanomermis culicivorax TaxID=13658 RepID=A0A915K7W5_ROMCU
MIDAASGLSFGKRSLSRIYTEVELPDMAFKYDHYLFNASYNYVDLSFDENALWAVYRYEHEHYLVAVQLNYNTLDIQKTWNLTEVSHYDVGNTFVICGTLYLVDNAYDLQSHVSRGFDFYREKWRHLKNVYWKNLHKNTNMAAYNRYDKLIYVTDHGYYFTVEADLKWR